MIHAVNRYIDLYYEHCATMPLLNNQEIEVIKRLSAEIRAEENEACAKAAKMALGGRAHTYASENADIYRAGDHALAMAEKAIRSRMKESK